MDKAYIVTLETDLNYWDPSIYPHSEWSVTDVRLFRAKEKAVEFIHKSTGQYPDENGRLGVLSGFEPARVIQIYEILERDIC